jgi:hypothetical protein
MGLDMYLRGKRYVSGYDFAPADDQQAYNNLVRAFAVRGQIAPHTPSAEVSFTVAYWRKANAIHQWFVKNVQNGVDDCGSYYVEREQLIALRAECEKIIAAIRVDDGQVHVGTTWDAAGQHENYRHGQVIVNPDVAASTLPTTSGFFFGSTDYDEGYIADLHDTVTQINRALNLNDDWSFEYEASW